jgi:hypothetical protein
MEQIWINLMRIRNTGSIIPKMLFIEKVLIDVVKKREIYVFVISLQTCSTTIV